MAEGTLAVAKGGVSSSGMRCRIPLHAAAPHPRSPLPAPRYPSSSPLPLSSLLLDLRNDGEDDGDVRRSH
uniref:Uncharacterized protein n=1 Tax=Oryza sativa subsp. japonica TaxID=39947 RepID=Q84YP2_ORYSJ|nr:hypothetical protein [Oryza sativa Japonica Group]